MQTDEIFFPRYLFFPNNERLEHINISREFTHMRDAARSLTNKDNYGC